MSKYKIFGNTTQSLKLPAFDPLYNLDLTNNQTIPPEYTFTRNSAGTYVGPDGFIKTANANQPRFDYDPITKEFKGLLIEESRSNSVPNSNTGNPGGASVNVNVSTSGVGLDGVTSATQVIVPSGPLSSTEIRWGGNLGGSGPWGGSSTNTRSFYVKVISGSSSIITGQGGGGDEFTWNLFNLSYSSDSRHPTGGVTYVGNGWYRCWIGPNGTGSGTYSFMNPVNTGTYLFWGFQAETGSFPTSYIPTSGSAVTRLPDQLVLNQSLSTSGTFFIEARPTMGTTLVADNGTNAYYISPTLNTTTKNALYYNTNRVLTMSSSNTSTLGQSTNYQSTSGLNRVSLGFDRLNNTNYINGHIKNFKYYDSPVTEDNLRSLTGSNKNISRVADGLIVTNGLVLNLDAGNPSSYPGSGTTWTDLSGNGNNGTLVNGPTYSSANGGSIVFNPTTVTSHHVNCGNILNFTTENFSFNIFFYLTSTTTNSAGQGPILFYRGPYLQDGYYIQINQANPCGVSFITNQPGAFQTTSSSSLLIVGTWNCVSVVRSGSSVKTYINGIDATAFAGTHINPATSVGANFLLATYAVSIYANIRIGSFQAYNRALSPTEVQQNFNALRGRFGI